MKDTYRKNVKNTTDTVSDLTPHYSHPDARMALLPEQRSFDCGITGLEEGSRISNETRPYLIHEAYDNLSYLLFGLREATIGCDLFRGRSHEVVDLCYQILDGEDLGPRTLNTEIEEGLRKPLGGYAVLWQLLKDDLNQEGVDEEMDQIKRAFFCAFDREIRVLRSHLSQLD